MEPRNCIEDGSDCGSTLCPKQELPRYDDDNLPSVSGGKDNPPDRYQIFQPTGNVITDQAALNALSDQGFRVVTGLPTLPFDYLLFGTYKS